VLRFNGRQWLEQRSRVLVDLNAVYGHGAGVFVVGHGGTVLRLDRNDWKPLQPPTSQDLVDVYVPAANQAFAISRAGGVIHFDGKKWTVQNSPAACLSSVHGDPATGVLAAGCAGSILRLKP
jgi:hypothetical protein